MVQSHLRSKASQKKYRRSAGGLRPHLQCKALKGRRKDGGRKNSGEQSEKQAQNSRNRWKNRTSAAPEDRRWSRASYPPNGLAMPRRQIKSPPVSSGGVLSHKSETRIYAIADFAREGKRKKKALPLFLRSARLTAGGCGDGQGARARASPCRGPAASHSISSRGDPPDISGQSAANRFG